MKKLLFLLALSLPAFAQTPTPAPPTSYDPIVVGHFMNDQAIPLYGCHAGDLLWKLRMTPQTMADEAEGEPVPQEVEAQLIKPQGFKCTDSKQKNIGKRRRK